MREIFLDCGAWEGSSIKAFKRYYENADDYMIYAFECEPRLKNSIESLSKEYGFTFVNKAVWIHGGVIQLYPAITDSMQSGSLMLSKKKYIDKENPVIVDAVDFSRWIMDNFNKDDYIICKMNIEGAEYDILEKMIEDNSIQYIDKLYVAWHNNKITGISDDKHNTLISKLSKETQLKGYNFENEKDNPF